MNKIFKQIRYALEAAITKVALWLLSLPSPKKSGDIASKLARFIGKKISVQKLAYNNLSKAIPALSENEKEKILDDMWDNLGRIIGEFPHVCAYSPQEILQFVAVSDEVLANIEEIKKIGKGGIIFSGHIGNWELGPKTLMASGINVSTVYRPLNNPYVEEMTGQLRGVDMIGKNSAGNRRIIEVIKSGGFVIILADQKISEGEKVKFFHDDAVTTTSIARMVLKYGVPLIPARIIRLGHDFKFKIDLEKPLVIEKTADLNSDILQLTRKINRKLEEWISQYPAQWFWVHNRWKK